jgi:hypothetical protein
MADATPQLSLKAELTKAIQEMDARTSSFSEAAVFDKLRDVLGNEQVSQEDFATYQGESDAFMYSPKRKDEAPFSGYFQPMTWYPKSDGSIAYSPDPATLTPSTLILWREHLQASHHPVLRARYADLLWEFQKRVDGTKAPLQYAQTAIDAYLASSAQADAASHEVVAWLARAINLATSVRDQIRLAAGVRQAIAWVQNTQGAQNARSYVFLFEAIYENRRVAGPEKAAIIAYLESELTATTNQSGTKFDFATAEIVADLLATHFRRSNNKTDEERVIRAAGLATEFAAGQATALFAMTWLQKLLERYRSFGMNVDADRVQVEARRRGMDSGQEMKKRPYTFSIPEETISAYRSWLIEPQKPRDVLLRWATSNAPSVKGARETLKQSLTATPLLARIGVTAINAGQFVSKAGSVEDDLEGRVGVHLRQMIEMRFNLFVGGWQHIQQNKSLSADDILGTLSVSPVFTEDGLELIREGLVRFFADDHLGTTHILLPQIECALRNLLRLLGRPTNKPVRGESGVMQERNMNEALGDPAVRAVLPEDFQRHLQIVFASRLGFNLRNVVAHGLLPASQFSILTSLMALQGLLLMSLIEVKKKVVAKKKASTKKPAAVAKKPAFKREVPAKKVAVKKTAAKTAKAKTIPAKTVSASKVARKAPSKKKSSQKGAPSRGSRR